jgi:hypothetical protein
VAEQLVKIDAASICEYGGLASARMVAATIIWLHAFAAWPEPSGPR